MAYPCYTKYNGAAKTPDITACAAINAKKRNTEFVAGQVGGVILV